MSETSWVQLVGMILLFIGTAVYNGSLPIFDYASAYQSINDDEEDEDLKQKADQAIVIRTPSHLASHSLMRSPMISRSIAQPVATKKNKKNGAGGNYQIE